MYLKFQKYKITGELNTNFTSLKNMTKIKGNEANPFISIIVLTNTRYSPGFSSTSSSRAVF